MAMYDWNTFRNYVAFLAGGTRRPHHDSELTSCYHEAFLTWGHNHDIVLFYHDSPIAQSHFMDPTDRAIKGFYCNNNNNGPIGQDWGDYQIYEYEYNRARH